MHEIEGLSNLKENRMALVELNNSKFYRVHAKEEDTNLMVTLRSIFRRTNELTVYECIFRNQEMPVQPNNKRRDSKSI